MKKINLESLNLEKLKKKLGIISICTLLGLCSFVFQIADNDKEKMQGMLQKVNGVPIEGKTIILDAGHGKPDGGAVSKNGIIEANINLQIAQKVKNLLKQDNIKVIMTRSDENGIYDESAKTISQKKVSDIKNRVKIGNNSQADIFVSIHLNKIEQEKYWGWQCFFKGNDEKSKKLSNSIQRGLNKTIQKENTRVPMKISKVYLVDHVNIPITVVECGFLSNNEEEKLLQDEDYQENLAWGIYQGIKEYFE